MVAKEKIKKDKRNDVEAERADDEFNQAIRGAFMERELRDAQNAEVESAPSQDKAGQQPYDGFKLPRSFRKHAGKLGDSRNSDDEKFVCRTRCGQGLVAVWHPLSFHFHCGTSDRQNSELMSPAKKDEPVKAGTPNQPSRRKFLATMGAATASALWFEPSSSAAGGESEGAQLSILPKGPSPAPVPFPHFPDRLHAFIWRNWELVPIATLAGVLGTSTGNVVGLAAAMGLPKQARISVDQQRRSYISVIKRNWHLLPYEQLLELLGWNAEQLAYTLREDDFLYAKLGGLKPNCPQLTYVAPDSRSNERAREIAAIVKRDLGELRNSEEPLFAFVRRLSRKAPRAAKAPQSNQPRFCYSYFALYGDPLLDDSADPYPDGYLARLAQTGVNGVWLQAVLYKLAPFPWQPGSSKGYETRLKNLRKLVARARDHGIGIYLYLNEPRSMPLRFFENHRDLKGVTEGEHATLCTSNEEVRNYLTGAIGSICRAVPDLEAFFTITASENLTNCWSHGAGAKCPRCSKRTAAEVIAEVNSAIFKGIASSGARTRLLVWDWGWANEWAPDVIERLPRESILQSVSEWDLPIQRGAVASNVGEYSISAVGPGPRAKRHWALAKKRGMKVSAKIQAGNTWELSAVPYIPAIRNVAQHALNLREAGVDGVILGWTLGGYPSPNLEVVSAIDELARQLPVETSRAEVVDRTLMHVAARRFGSDAAPHVVEAWNEFSRAFSEFPYHIGVVYSAPLQVGPANLLWEKPTGYTASMVGLPYDDLERWRGIYPPETFANRLEKVADGFDSAVGKLRNSTAKLKLTAAEKETLASELRVADAAAIHFRTVANQTRFVLGRNGLAGAKDAEVARAQIEKLETLLQNEMSLARRLYELQRKDSRIGFEASNQYYYVPLDLAEKVLNCRDLLDRWLPEQRRKWKV